MLDISLRNKILLFRFLYQLLPLLAGVQKAAYAHCIVSELYRDPPGPEGEEGGGATHEFIEIVNIGRDTVSLDSLFVTNGIEADSIVQIRTPIIGHERCRYGVSSLLPGQIAVLLDADYREWAKTHDAGRLNLADETILLECGDREFGSNGLAADHGVVLYRGTKQRIDALVCGAVDPSTVIQTPTAETIRLSGPDNIEGYSVVATGVLSGNPSFDYAADSTDPGSFAPLRDGWLLEYRFTHHDLATESVECSLFVQNLLDTDEGAVRWWIERCDETGGTEVASGVLTLDRGYGAAMVQLHVDSVQLRWRIEPLVTIDGYNAPQWTIDGASFWLSEHSVCITELFPRATANEPEWIEVYNSTAVPVNLKGWRLCVSADTMVLSCIDRIVAPAAYMVIGRNATALQAKYRYLVTVCVPDRWISFDNSGDTVTLLDQNGAVHETVCYDKKRFSSWPSVSLERIGNCRNGDDEWIVADRSSPGLPGQCGTRDARKRTEPELDIGPLPFTPDNDGRDDLLAIRLALHATGSVTVFIYGFDGTLQRTFPEVRSNIIYWDGRGTRGYLPPGPFFVVAEIVDGTMVRRSRKKGILWRR